jgi:hypothetical protein
MARTFALVRHPNLSSGEVCALRMRQPCNNLFQLQVLRFRACGGRHAQQARPQRPTIVSDSSVRSWERRQFRQPRLPTRRVLPTMRCRMRIRQALATRESTFASRVARADWQKILAFNVLSVSCYLRFSTNAHLRANVATSDSESTRMHGDTIGARVRDHRVA